MLKFSVACIAVLALLPALAQAQNPRACSVGAVWRTLKEPRMGSGNMLLGEFSPSVSREPVIKHFKYYDTGLVVTAGVRYVYPEKASKPDFMELALVVSDREEPDVFHAPRNAVSGLLFKKGWRHFTLSRNVEHDERLNTFSLHCWESQPNRR